MAQAGDAPPVGVVIKEDDGSHSIWNGKQWLPAVQSQNGWGVDKGKMSSMGLGAAAGPLSPTDAKQVADIQTSAGGIEGLSAAAEDFLQRNARTPTGGMLAIPGVPTIMKAIKGPSSDLAAMDRDSVGMAISLRAPGQRLTQMEFLKNLGAGPSVRNTVGNNTQVAQQIFNGNTLAQAKAAFFSTYLNTHRTLAGAIPAWLGWKNQHFDEAGGYSHDPISHQQAAGAALKARSAQGSSAPAILEPGDYLK